jgi:hypothetical protein
MTTYYKDLQFEFQRGVREVAGHSVDLINMELNLDHPSMQLPGQKEQMLALFNGGRMAYESTVIGKRIYWVSPGGL